MQDDSAYSRVHHERLVIGKSVIVPGKEEHLKLDVGRLPSGTRVQMNLFVYRSSQPGPVLLVMAGVHGDEVNGIEIVRQAVDSALFKDLQCGSVIAIPVVNIFGFNSFSRDIGEGKDVNRSFPGSKTGSLASRLAYLVAREVLPVSDIVIDFHTGGASRYNYPQLRYTRGSAEGLQLASEFGARFIIEKPVIRGSLRKVARDVGVPIIIYEAGEAMRIDDFAIGQGVKGLKRVLTARKMLAVDPGVPNSVPLIHVTKMQWVRAARAGIFTAHRRAGAIVAKGEVLGTIADPFGVAAYTVQAPRSGYVLSHNNIPIVGQGDALFNIAHSYSELASGKAPGIGK